MNNGARFVSRLVHEGFFRNLERHMKVRNQLRHFYHGFGVYREWVGFETTALEVYPDRIRQFHG